MLPMMIIMKKSIHQILLYKPYAVKLDMAFKALKGQNPIMKVSDLTNTGSHKKKYYEILFS